MTQSSEVSNLVKLLVGKKVISNASITADLVPSLPNQFYYKGSDISTENDYSVDVPKWQGTYNGNCYLDIQTVPIYDVATNNKIGTVTFHDYSIKSSASPAVVSEKVIFNFNSTNNTSLTTEYSFLSDSLTYPNGLIKQRIVAGTGDYLNLFGYHVELEKRADNNRYINIVHN
jgi:hypothetical protein